GPDFLAPIPIDVDRARDGFSGNFHRFTWRGAVSRLHSLDADEPLERTAGRTTRDVAGNARPERRDHPRDVPGPVGCRRPFVRTAGPARRPERRNLRRPTARSTRRRRLLVARSAYSSNLSAQTTNFSNVRSAR